MAGFDQILASSGTDLDGLKDKFGLSADQTEAALGSLLPAILGGFRNKVSAGDAADLDTAATGIDQPDTSIGNEILGHIFGSKDVSRQVAGDAAAKSGVSTSILKAMLPIVAAMVAKYFASGANGNPSGGLGGVLGSILGGGQNGGLGGMLGGEAGTNPLDEILARFR